MQTPAPQIEPSPTISEAASLVAVAPDRVPDVLRIPAVRGLLIELVERHHGELSLKGIYQRLMTDWVLWLVWTGEVKAVLATELYFDVGGMKRCRIPFCTGSGAKQWVHLLAEIEAWARAEGCKKLDVIARKGWARQLPDYKMTHVLLEKAL